MKYQQYNKDSGIITIGEFSNLSKIVFIVVIVFLLGVSVYWESSDDPYRESEVVAESGILLAWSPPSIKVSENKRVNVKPSKFVDRFKSVAIQEEKLYGIPASITLAQGIIESAHGKSSLAVESNNYFGIKSGSSYQGDCHYLKDDDFVKGKLVESCFRKYKSAWWSFRDHSNLLQKKRYAKCFTYGDDYKKWAHGLQKAGYATSKSYANKLIEVIEAYGLDKI